MSAAESTPRLDYSLSAHDDWGMTERANLRKNLGLTQTAAAIRASVSLATWRRWEVDPASVAGDTAQACERVLSVRPLRIANDDELFERQWESHSQITPRQAFALAVTLGAWADEINAWMADPEDEPLHQVGPFAQFDRRVMFHIGESRAFAAEVGDRCDSVAREIEDGILPHMRRGMFIDDVLVGAALTPSQHYLEDMPELFENIAPRSATGEEIGDDDWDQVSDWIDDEAYAADWELPLGWPMLPLLLENRHPFTWFDIHRDPPNYSLHRSLEDRLPAEGDF